MENNMPTEPIYSDDPVEEARMLAIRDDAGSRVAQMARSRVAAGRRHIPISSTELVWLLENDHVPLLEPREADRLITALAYDLSRCERHRDDLLELVERAVKSGSVWTNCEDMVLAKQLVTRPRTC